MKKAELLQKLSQYPDDMDVKLYDHRMLLHHASDEPTKEGLYSDFEVHQLNDDLGLDEIKYTEEVHGFTPKPFIVLSFDNDDYTDDGDKND